MSNISLIIILEDVRSIFNVGSVFRTADAAGVEKIILSGLTAHPPHPRLEKTALGATKFVEWEYHQNLDDVIERLKKENFQLVACELDQSAKNVFETKCTQNTCLIFGNEVTGVSSNTLEKVDDIIEIPMLGSKKSLNIATAAGIIMYEYRRKLNFDLSK